MRTKALVGLAALAVSAATCVAQSNVYSLNIVGYVNVDVAKGMNLLSVPLKPADNNNNITNTIVLADNMDGSVIYKWAGTSWASATPSWIAGEGWDDASTQIGVGEAFFLKAENAGKITFVGEVATGTLNYTFTPGINFVANQVPVDEAFPGKLVGNDGDTIFTWKGASWNSETWGYVAGEGWIPSGASPGVDGPVLKAGEGAVYQNTGPELKWTRAFNPQ